MKKRQQPIRKIETIFLAAFFNLIFYTQTAFGVTSPLNTPQRLTTHTADDYQPAVSPDGKNVAFVSSRSGSNDIWLIPINGGPGKQLTRHTSSDTDPAWSRDGERIAFTSLREDSKGDIWIVDLEGGRETRVTDSKAAESHPSWFPDGWKIAFSRRGEVWTTNLTDGKEERLFKGFYPSVSPDGRFIAYVSFEEGARSEKREAGATQNNGSIWIYEFANRKSLKLTAGDYPDAFPSWSPDAKEIYFSRFSEDTDGDGHIDIKDNPSIWKISVPDSSFIPHPSSLKEVQLTSASSYEISPSVADDCIVFAARGKDLDIYRVSRDGEVPRLKGAREQLDLAYKVKGHWPAILAFRRVYLSGFPEDQDVFAEAKYQVALKYQELGLKKDAVRELRTLIRSFPKGRRYVSLAEVEISKILVNDAIAAGDNDGASKEMDVLKGVIERYGDQPYSQAMAQLEIGDIHLALKDDVRALREYERVRELYPTKVGAVVLARLKMADIYASYGDEKRVIDTYVSIIKDYPESEDLGLAASQRVLSLIEKMGDEKELLSRYRDLVSRYKGLPYLPAMAQYKIGEFYHIKERFSEALREYRDVLEKFPSETLVSNEASLAMAEVGLSEGSYENALTIYEGLMKKGDRRAKRLYIKASLEKARSELSGKEPAQAIKTCRLVIDLDYREVRAHRTLIEAFATKGEPQKAVAIYKDDTERLPESDTAHYALGLAYTYLEDSKGTVPDLRTERSGVVESGLSPLLAAEAEIKKALSINYSNPFAHQTLGWIYEVRDRLGIGKTIGLAVDEYLAALSLLSPEQKKEAADLLLNIGNGYSAMGNHEKGYEYYKKRLETGIPFDDQRREAVFFENIGNEASRIGRYMEAVPYYTRALDYASKAKDRSWELKVTEEIALLYQEARDYGRAAEFFSNALKIAEEEKMEERKALLLRNIAYNYYHAGKVEEAISFFNKSLDFLKAKEEVSTAAGLLTIKKAVALGKEDSEAFMGFEKAGEEKLIYSYLGRAYAETGEYEPALTGLLKKLELIPEEGRETEKGIVLNNIGFLYYQMGETENAYRYFKASMEASRKAGNFTGEMVNIVNIGLLAAQPQREADIEEAVKLQERGIGLIESEKRGSDYLPYLRNNLGLLYLKSSISGQRSAVSKKRANDLNTVLKTSLDIIKEDANYLKKAVEQFKAAVDALPKKKDPWLEALLKLNLATALYCLGNDKESSNHLASAMKLIEENFINDLKWRCLWLLARLDDKNRLKHLEDAVAALEGQEIPSGPPLIKGGFGDTESLFKEIISSLFSSGRLDDAFTYAERMAMNRVKVEAARVRYPLQKGEAPLSARDVQWFLDEKTAVIRYLATGAGLLIWVIDSDNVQGRIAKVSLKDLGSGIADFLSSLSEKELKDRLSPMIMEPVAGLLTNKKRLYVIPDETLSSVPFPALSIGSSPLAAEDKGGGGEFLVDRFEIAYLPSASILNAAYEKRNLNKVNILISQGEGYSDRYVDAVGSKTPIYAALRGNKEKFLDMASNYGILHITDPLSINQAVPFRSVIQLGREKLTLSELAPLKLTPSLVVLSNIKPTLTLHPLPEGEGRGEGPHPSSLISSLQPFIFAGSPSVLVKTIPTDRGSEELFMREFYEAFRKESAAAALGKAQRALKSKGYPPSAWAGYALYGYSGMDQEEERKYASRRVADIMNSAIDAYSKGEWKDSIRRFEEGLLFLKTIGAVENLGSIYKALAVASANSGDFAKGASYQEEFIKAGKLSKPELAEGYKTLAILCSKGGNDKKAEEAIKEGIRLWEGIGEKERLSESYHTLALLQEKAGSYHESIASFKAALEIDRGLSDMQSAGQDLWDIGRIYYLRLSRFDEALSAYNEALSIFKDTDKGKTAGVLMDIGLVFEQEGEYEAAKKHYLQGIKIAEEINDRSAFSRGNLYMANVAWHTGDYQEAFGYQKVALDTAIELKDRKQEAMAHNLAGLTYMNLGMLESSLDSLTKSLSISIETGERLDAAAAYNNIGIVQRELGSIEKSIESFKKALTIDTELKSKWGMAYDLRNLGISYERLGMLKEALGNLNSSLDLSREIGERKNEAMTLYSLGTLYQKMGKSEEAFQTLKEAYGRGRELNLPEVVWRSLKAMAGISIQRRELPGAYQDLREAIEVVERMRGRIKIDEYKTGFLENKADLYEEMVLLLLRMGKADEAFNYAERGRSRNFIDMLGNQRIKVKSSSSQGLLDMERGLSRRIESLEERIRKEKGETIIEELKKARKDYESLLLSIKEESPELAPFVTVDPPTLRDIQRAIPKDTVLLEYLVTREGVVVWVLSSEGIDSVTVPMGKGVIREKVATYRGMLERVIPVERESLELYNLLIRPVERFIEGSKYIGIVPHDILHYLSFSSLFDGRRYLMESHPIFYSPSASVLKMVVDRHVGAYRNTPLQKFLVIGNPDLGDSAYDLPFAEREAMSIAREYEGSEVLIRKEATETRVRGDIGGFNGIHFASHGVYDSVTPLFSTLKLAGDGNNDGNLTANEAFSLDIKASLVMMSACQTGLGKVTTGDEIIGLNRAFIYAGGNSIVSTLWRVNDAASAMLVKRFYRYYKGNDIAESLRLAQMAVKDYYPHPAYWAGFGLTGDFR
jgi:CHAT domain-containing protein/Tfp pilus assembly protein PilF